MVDTSSKRIKYLLLGLFFDLLGMLSYFIPGIGEFSDLIWAPLAGWLMTRMYQGQFGKTAGVVTFLEELLPGTDILPTFTLMWIYTFLIKKETGEERLEANAG